VKEPTAGATEKERPFKAAKSIPPLPIALIDLKYHGYIIPRSKNLVLPHRRAVHGLRDQAPEGLPIIARRFNAGFARKKITAPEKRLNRINRCTPRQAITSQPEPPKKSGLLRPPLRYQLMTDLQPLLQLLDGDVQRICARS
jgi:hypothetical protein